MVLTPLTYQQSHALWYSVGACGIQSIPYLLSYDELKHKH